MIIHCVYPPIITVTQPTAGIAPQTQTSDVRNACFPPINTVALPVTNGETETCGDSEEIAQVCWSPITAAGSPPISTVGIPGPVMMPPCVEISVTLTAAAIVF